MGAEYMKRCASLFWLCLCSGWVAECTKLDSSEAVNLAGRWRYALDRSDQGVSERWFAHRLGGRLNLPGSLQGQGLGDPVTVETAWTGGIVDKSWFSAPEYARYRQPGHIKVPFWLQPQTHYTGAAWYQRDIEIPSGWQGLRMVLTLERPHWETRVWVDDRIVGTNLSLSTPHEYDLGSLAPGRHQLTVRVDNRMVIDIGENSHSISDHTQGNWNGIAGALTLRGRAPVWVDELQVFAHPSSSSIRILGNLGNATGKAGQGRLVVSVRETGCEGRLVSDPHARIPATWSVEGGRFDHEIRLLVPPKHWDEFDPNLYSCEVSLEGLRGGKTVKFGFREMRTAGTQFTMNGRKVFIRGTLECCIFPRTGHPPTGAEGWRKVIRAAKAHGLNNLRFHSWCPPEAAFAVADEMGMYLHVEASTWPNQSTTLGDGKPVDGWLYEETDRILKWYGNHPSFVLMASGNEPGGSNHAAYLARWVTTYRDRDPRRLYTSGAGWPQIPENQWHSSPDPRVQAWGGGLKSRLNARPPETKTDYRDYIASRSVPVVSHEIGQWCVYPRFKEMPKYTGYLRPRNFEIFRDTLAAKGMISQAEAFVEASGKLQALCYKEDIESALRTAGMGGFQLLDLHDFPGQGTALVGVLDPFWEQKGYITPAEFRRFCQPIVPLARLEQRVFAQDQSLAVECEVAHFGKINLPGVKPTYRILHESGREVLRGDLGWQSIASGQLKPLGIVKVPLEGFRAPERYRFVLSLGRDLHGDRELIENDWDIWVYPVPSSHAEAAPPEVHVTRALDDFALDRLDQGGSVLWLLDPSKVNADRHGKVALGFSTIFWNTAWTARQAPHTMGILCDPKHPLFREFPTESHSNWQWWYLIRRSGAMILDGLPQQLRPTVQVVDDWFTARKLGLVFEARVGKGKLAVCSIDLEPSPGQDLVTRQFRRSLFRYVASKDFNPKVELKPAQLAETLGVGLVAGR